MERRRRDMMHAIIRGVVGGLVGALVGGVLAFGWLCLLLHGLEWLAIGIGIVLVLVPVVLLWFVLRLLRSASPNRPWAQPPLLRTLGGKVFFLGVLLSSVGSLLGMVLPLVLMAQMLASPDHGPIFGIRPPVTLIPTGLLLLCVGFVLTLLLGGAPLIALAWYLVGSCLRVRRPHRVARETIKCRRWIATCSKGGALYAVLFSVGMAILWILLRW